MGLWANTPKVLHKHSFQKVGRGPNEKVGLLVPLNKTCTLKPLNLLGWEPLVTNFSTLLQGSALSQFIHFLFYSKCKRYIKCNLKHIIYSFNSHFIHRLKLNHFLIKKTLLQDPHCSRGLFIISNLRISWCPKGPTISYLVSN